jgi:FSR family fosmidomycin resistance protein-like MFS transporter
LTSAGFLTTISRIPSIFHPFVGYLADKKGARYFVIFTPAITATMMSLLGQADSYANLAVLLFLAGLSSTVFHASSPGLVASASSERKGYGLSLFMAGGGLGRSLGPLLLVWAISCWGLEGIHRLMFLGWAASMILLLQFRQSKIPPSTKPSLKAALPGFKRFFIPLSLAIILRSILTASLNSYLPIYMVESGAPLWIAGAALSVLEISGVIGALLIGPFSDDFGRRKSISICMAVSATIIPFFLSAEGWRVFPLLLVLGFFNLPTGTLFLALVQDSFQDHRATGNGFYLLISFLSNGLMVTAMGLIADNFGLNTAFLIGAVASLLAIPSLQLLPVKGIK